MIRSRRAFLRTLIGGSAAVSLSPALPAFLARSARAAGRRKHAADTVLVVLQLSGGNDGLNTIVPYADDVYARSRRTLRLTGRQVHRIDDLLGFHPAMNDMARLFAEGQLSVVQGVGYPNSDRSHPGATRDWHTARPGDSSCQTGWLGRAVDQLDQPGEPDVPAALVAPIPMPMALVAERAVVPKTVSAQQWKLATSVPPRGEVEEGEARRNDTANHRAESQTLLDYVDHGMQVAYATSRKVSEVLRHGGPSGAYPSLPLARQLNCIAQLIRADVGVRIFFAELGGGGIGGFDNHANQRDNHAALLAELSKSVAAFVDDLRQAGLLDRVLLMTTSEFGRTVTENGRRGTGHGAAAPVLVAGGRLRGGLVGPHPRLDDLVGDAPKFHTDYRRLYATALEQWLGLDSRPILGGRFAPVELLA